MSMEFFTNSILRTHSIAFPSDLRRLRQEFSHAQKVISSSYPPSGQLGFISPFIAGSSEPSHGLHPTKDLFDSLSDTLTQAIARMASGAAIDSRPPSSLAIGRHVRSNPSLAQKVDKVLGVIALIGPQSSHPEPFSPLTFEHPLGRLPHRCSRWPD